MSEDRTARLPPGYTLDIVGDPCILILRNPDGAVVARFPRNVDPAEIKTSRRIRSLTKGLKTSLECLTKPSHEKLLLRLDQHSPLVKVGSHHPFNALLLPR